ncbi:MAG: CPBP family intramembrane metalloprotease [Pseudobacteriovorax sp.]|nr:CPBP family intramembrane metalloprotease [Pseudobacteriovorax sp.]
MTNRIAEQKPNFAKEMLRNSSLFYGVMVALGLLTIHYQYNNLGGLFGAVALELPFLETVIATGLAFLCCLVAHFLLSMQFASYRAYRSIMTRIIGRLPLYLGLYLAVLSAFAEEVLFRAAIQPQMGLVLTTILFSLIHAGPMIRLGPWTLMTVIVGILCGWLFDRTGILWPSLFIHAGFNICSIVAHKLSYNTLIASSDSGSSEQLTERD